VQCRFFMEKPVCSVDQLEDPERVLGVEIRDSEDLPEYVSLATMLDTL